MTEVCCVCLDNLDNETRNTLLECCGKRIHTDCHENWLNEDHGCPYCRDQTGLPRDLRERIETVRKDVDDVWDQYELAYSGTFCGMLTPRVIGALRAKYPESFYTIQSLGDLLDHFSINNSTDDQIKAITAWVVCFSRGDIRCADAISRI